MSDVIDRQSVQAVLAGRSVALAYAIIVALYLVRHIRFPPIQIPAYLLIVSYDLVERSLPTITPYHPVGFPMYLYLLAVVSATVARWARAGPEGTFDWRRAAGGVSIVVGILSLLFAAFVGGPLISATDNPTPLAITGTAGVLLLLAAWWLLADVDP